MTLGESVRVCLRKYGSFKGRATRAELWWWFLSVFLALIVVIVVGSFLVILPGADVLTTILALAILLPSLAVTARRLHDIGRSGWWILECFLFALLGLFPIAFSGILLLVLSLNDIKCLGFFRELIDCWILVILGAALSVLVSSLLWPALIVWWVILMVKQGQRGPNRHGSDPRAWEPVVSE